MQKLLLLLVVGLSLTAVLCRPAVTPAGLDLETKDFDDSNEDESSDDDGSVTWSWEGQGEFTVGSGDYFGSWATGVWETGPWATESTDVDDDLDETTDEN